MQKLVGAKERTEAGKDLQGQELVRPNLIKAEARKGRLTGMTRMFEHTDRQMCGRERGVSLSVS